MPKVAQLNSTQSTPVDPLAATRARLSAALALLTMKQRGAIDAIIAAEMTGQSIDSLIAAKAFSHKTYYGAGGWYHNEQFQTALKQAREVSFDARLSAAVRRARETIVLAAPDAAARLVAMLEIEDKPEIALRASESILNRADRSVADRSGGAAAIVTGDDIAGALAELDEWKQARGQG